MDTLSNFIFSTPISIFFGIFIFFILREVITWYWKINKAIDLLEKIEKNTRKEEVVKIEPKPATPTIKQ